MSMYVDVYVCRCLCM